MWLLMGALSSDAKHFIASKELTWQSRFDVIVDIFAAAAVVVGVEYKFSLKYFTFNSVEMC